MLFPSSRLKCALVIGTYGAPAYIELQLENLRQLGVHLPVLVHDDCSANGEELGVICRKYSAAFVSTTRRLGHYGGDAEVFARGFQWARRLCADVLVKFSRRFVPTYDWLEEFQRLAHCTQSPTYSRAWRHRSRIMRTECAAFHVNTWMRIGCVERIRRHLRTRHKFSVERLMNRIATTIPLKAYTVSYPPGTRQPPPKPFVDWNIMNEGRKVCREKVLWHNYSSPREYWELANALGLARAPEEYAV